MNEKTENLIAGTLLSILCLVYVFFLIAPSSTNHYHNAPKNFVLPTDTKESFEAYLVKHREMYPWHWTGKQSQLISEQTALDDDFFLKDGEVSKNEPIVASNDYHCKRGWVLMRSRINYKFLWMHGEPDSWMSATATVDTPYHYKTFEMIPVDDCATSGWVLLHEGDSKSYVMMVPPVNPPLVDEWVVKTDTSDFQTAHGNEQYHFLLEKGGYVLNKASMAFLNVLSDGDYAVRGHDSWHRGMPAGREFGAMIDFEFIEDSYISESIAKEAEEIVDAKNQDEKDIAAIQNFPSSSEKRVISFGLYGNKEKYTTGAIRNTELVKVYFPGWVCRFYHTDDVPASVLQQLKDSGAELFQIPSGMGYAAGMFYRFLVAADTSVDRYIVRDVDSRLNARDRFAVEDWITSKQPIHVMRDHVNHCIPMNGGMWGGVMGALPNIEEMVLGWPNRDEYMADLHFLEERVWPDVKHRHIAHDSYCCDQFINTKAFPTKRPPTFLHVGQVFDAKDRPRRNDIEGFIRGVPTPASCRKEASWIFG